MENRLPSPGICFRRARLMPIVVAFTFALTSCETAQLASSNAPRSGFAEAPNDRPGLGTKWGESRESRVELTGFVRVDPAHPLGTAAIFYNDAEGIRAMTGRNWWWRGWAMLPAPAQGLISVGLKSEGGRLLPGTMANGKWFVVGEPGRRYSIVIRNRTNSRLEVVASVDGLDVIDGRRASVLKRGYLIGPHAEQVIEGFRQSAEAVAAFRFSPVNESYAAQKHHDTRNVGVIGVAIFSEKGSNLPTAAETRKRLEANPFPGRFATPPP